MSIRIRVLRGGYKGRIYYRGLGRGCCKGREACVDHYEGTKVSLEDKLFFARL